MGLKISSRTIIILIICIILIGAVYVVFNQVFISNENALKIISLELSKSEEGLNFTVTTTIQNQGTNDVNNATLNFIFIKDTDILDSELQSLNLETKTEKTYKTQFTDVTFETDNVYKIIASIYLENELLDTKTITKQF